MFDVAGSRERAYQDAMIRMRWSRCNVIEERADFRAQHLALANAALVSHAELRSRIADGGLRGRALREIFDAVPALEGRDHFVEEVLGIAYPPLELEDEHAANETIAYTPSGYDEIVHAFDTISLSPDDRVLDIGSGLGKAPLIAALLYKAHAIGIEIDERLHDRASQVVHELRADITLQCGDALTAPLDPNANIIFMYIPFTGSILANVMRRVLTAPRRYVISAALDLNTYPELETAGCPALSWLHLYKGRCGTSSTTSSSVAESTT